MSTLHLCFADGLLEPRLSGSKPTFADSGKVASFFAAVRLCAWRNSFLRITCSLGFGLGALDTKIACDLFSFSQLLLGLPLNLFWFLRVQEASFWIELVVVFFQVWQIPYSTFHIPLGIATPTEELQSTNVNPSGCWNAPPSLPYLGFSTMQCFWALRCLLILLRFAMFTDFLLWFFLLFWLCGVFGA